MSKITIDRATVEQALGAMSYADACLKKQLTTKTKHEHAQDMLLSVGSALRQALSDSVEQPAQQEPVAWRYKIVDCFGRPVWTLKTPKTDTRVLESQPLYANPQTIDKSAAIRIATALGWEPKREWVGLTDDEIDAKTDFRATVRYFEAKLKEKNT